MILFLGITVNSFFYIKKMSPFEEKYQTIILKIISFKKISTFRFLFSLFPHASITYIINSRLSIEKFNFGPYSFLSFCFGSYNKNLQEIPCTIQKCLILVMPTNQSEILFVQYLLLTKVKFHLLNHPMRWQPHIVKW